MRPRRRFGVCATSQLDPLIDDALSSGLPLKSIDAILRAVFWCRRLRLGANRKDVPGPRRVSGIFDVAHAFVEGGVDRHGNALLDQIARPVLRADEVGRAGG